MITVVQERGFNQAESVLLATLMSVPGYLAAFRLRHCPRRTCQLLGFGSMALGFLGLAAVGEPQSILKVSLYCALQTTNAATAGAVVRFIPAEVFPTCVRASCVGLSATAGAAGALVGASLLPCVLHTAGLPAAMVICALAAVVGIACTTLLTPMYDGQTLQDLARLRPSRDPRELTAEALERGDRFRQCPSCEVMTEREEGCNVITCTNCQDVWCFACGGKDCARWACSEVEASGPTLDSLPRLLWPRAQPDRAVPLVLQV